MLDAMDIKALIYEMLEEQELLTEGGAGGHMRHPFDLDDVKTGEDLIKKFEQIGSEIQGGNTPDTKIDGVNASIKVIDGPDGKEFAIDRGGVSKDDIQGISKSRLITRFQDFIGIEPEIDGQSEVREQRIIAKIQPDGTRVPYNWLEKSNPDSPKIAVGDKVIYKKTKLSPEEEVEITSIRPHGMRTGGNTLLSIFNDALPEIESELRELGLLDDPSKFFNMEFVKTGVNNVLNYDHNFLKIHGVNQFYEKENRGKPARSGLERPEGVHDPSVPVDYDKEVMDRMVEKINKFSDKYDFKVYSYIPSKATGDFDFSPVMNVPVPVTYSTDDVREETLGDRLKAAENRIGEMVELKNGRTIPVQGKEIYQAVLGTSAEDTNADPARQTPLDELLANEEDYQKAIDGAVFWHATRLMGNVIMNNMVVDHPAVKGPATDHEGLVIKLAGDDFGTKITGEFILGGEATSFRKPANADSKVEKEVEYKNIAIFPGSFKPPHKGHLSVIERVAKNPEVDEIKVIISAPGKNVRSLKITPEKAKDIFEKFISSSNIDKPVSVEISSKPSPITAAYDYIGEKAGPNENVLLLTSEADSKRYPQESLDKYAGMNKNAETLTVKGLVLPVCKDEGCQTTDKISATTIRNIVDAYPDITLDELTKAVDHMPDSMSTADKLAAFEMLVDDSLSNKFEDEELNTLNESVRFIMETIDKALDVVLLSEKVRKTKNKNQWCVFSKKGNRKFGCYPSKKKAVKRLRQVEYFKHMSEEQILEEVDIIEEVSASSGMGGMGYAGPFKGLIREED